jgi:hypothetical protein
MKLLPPAPQCMNRRDTFLEDAGPETCSVWKVR